MNYTLENIYMFFLCIIYFLCRKDVFRKKFDDIPLTLFLIEKKNFICVYRHGVNAYIAMAVF